MPTPHSINYYQEAVMEQHDIDLVDFTVQGLGQINVEVQPPECQQAVIDWLNDWKGRAIYLVFSPLPDEETTGEETWKA